MSSPEIAASRTRAQVRAPLGLLLALLVAAIATNLGVNVAATALAANTDSVSVTSTVPTNLQMSDTCSGSIALSVALGSFDDGTCAFQFGSTNDPTTTLRVGSSVGPLLGGGVFADHVGGCGALVNDESGFKVTAVGANVTAAHGCTVSAAGTNADFLAVPDAAAPVCSTTALGAANTCTLAVGIKETGNDATAGTYTGTLTMDVIA